MSFKHKVLKTMALLGLVNTAWAPQALAGELESLPVWEGETLETLLSSPTKRVQLDGDELFVFSPVSDIEGNRNHAQGLLDEVYLLAFGSEKLRQTLWVKNADPVQLAAFTGMSVGAACLVTGTDPCSKGRWQFNPFRKKIAFAFYPNGKQFPFHSWTNAPFPETLIFLDIKDGKLSLYELAQALVHELAIQLDSKSNHSYYYHTDLEPGESIDLRVIQKLNTPSLSKVFRVLRAFHFEYQVFKELNQVYKIDSFDGFYGIFKNFNKSECFKVAEKIFEIRSNEESLDPLDKKFLKKEAKPYSRKSWCEELSDPKVNGSFMLDGSGPRPRVGSWD